MAATLSHPGHRHHAGGGGVPEANTESLNAARAGHNFSTKISRADYKIDVWPSNRPQSNSYTPTTEVSAWNNSTNTAEFRQNGEQNLLSPGRVGFQSIPGFLVEIQEFIQQELDILPSVEGLEDVSSLDQWPAGHGGAQR